MERMKWGGGRQGGIGGGGGGGRERRGVSERCGRGRKAGEDSETEMRVER